MKPHRVLILLLSVLSLFPLEIASAETQKAGSLDIAQIGQSPPEQSPPEQSPPEQNPPKPAQAEAAAPPPVEFKPPVLSDRNRPGGRSEGAAGRGSCTTNNHQVPLTAIVPTTQETPADGPAYESVFSLTAEARPSFWFYVPYELRTTPIEFVLQDEGNNTLYRDNLSSNSPDVGIVQVTLPETTPELQQDTLYHWYFMAYCDLSSPSFVEGWVQRIALDARVTLALDNATPRARAVIYAENGLWQETVTLLGERYRQEPNNTVHLNDWHALLESANLERVAEKPLIDCCSAPVTSPVVL